MDANAYSETEDFVLVKKSRLHLAPFSDGPTIRFCDLFRRAWNHIPVPDRRLMTNYWSEMRKQRGCEGEAVPPTIYVGYSLNQNGEATCWDMGKMLSFGAYSVEVSDDERVQAIIGHELAHVRACCDEPDHAEETAIEWAVYKWKFANVSPVFKSPSCHGLDKYARRRGLGGSVYLQESCIAKDQFVEDYIYLPPGEMFGCDPADDTWEIGLDVEEAQDHLRAIATLKKEGGLAWSE